MVMAQQVLEIQEEEAVVQEKLEVLALLEMVLEHMVVMVEQAI